MSAEDTGDRFRCGDCNAPVNLFAAADGQLETQGDPFVENGEMLQRFRLRCVKCAAYSGCMYCGSKH